PSLPLLLSFLCSRPPPALPSFPTRRSSDLDPRGLLPGERLLGGGGGPHGAIVAGRPARMAGRLSDGARCQVEETGCAAGAADAGDRKSTRLNSSHLGISYAVFCLKKKNRNK